MMESINLRRASAQPTLMMDFAKRHKCLTAPTINSFNEDLSVSFVLLRPAIRESPTITFGCQIAMQEQIQLYIDTFGGYPPE